MKALLIRFLLIFSSLWAYPLMAFAQNEDSAIVIMYHRFNEDKFPTTNVTLDQFDAHIKELSNGNYNVVPLKTITEAMEKGEKLPPRTVSITIDDGYLSIFEHAWPRLKAAGLPFTLFISTQSVNVQNKSSMTWDQIRTLEQDPLVDIGHHGHSHGHMIEMSIDEALNDIALADEIYQKELGYIPDIFAFPYGEFNVELIDQLKLKNYKAAFGQYSSALNSGRNIMALPRFSFNENYADLERFKLIINSRALPVKDILPRFSVLNNNPPVIGFTLMEEISGLAALNCFPSHMSEPATLSRLGDTRVEIRFDQPFPVGRHRINCTMPGPDRRWYWFGMPFFNIEQ